MKQLGIILTEDGEIVNSTNVYSQIYNIVKQFVDKYDLQSRKIGSKLNFWLNIDCEKPEDKPAVTGYYFETTIKENLVEDITKKIIWRFENSIEELIENKCNILIDKGL